MRDIVAGAHEGVDGAQRAPALRREDDEGVVEVASAAARDLLGAAVGGGELGGVRHALSLEPLELRASAAAMSSALRRRDSAGRRCSVS